MISCLQYYFIKHHDLFHHLSDNDTIEFCRSAEFKTKVKDEFIYNFKDEITRFYTVLQGRIKIAFYREKGVEVVSEILKEGDIFGQLKLEVSPNSNCEFAQVLSHEALICEIELDKLRELLTRNVELAANLSMKIGQKIEIINRKFSDLVFKNVKARVLNFFILHARYEGKWSGNKVEINMYCNQQDIANFTASSRQTVSTIINELVDNKTIIFQGRNKLTIPDVRRLEN